jgi:DNA repair exonuclease SbcCD ATPase subunit
MLTFDPYYIAAKNFRCFGPEGIEIDFRKLGKIVLIKGKNLDRQAHGQNANDDDEVKSRNGVGKTSVPEIITFTLKGQTLKVSRSQDVAINKRTKKNLYSEVRWGKYRVVRTRKPNTLRVWESEDQIWNDATEKTLGGIPATQELIDNILGLSHQTLVNTVVFTDKNKDAFLECDTATKRDIVENLLSLGTYAQYHEAAKNFRNEHQKQISLMAKNYERMLGELNSAKERVKLARDQEKTWKSNKLAELNTLVKEVQSKKDQLSKTDDGAALLAYNEAQAEIKTLNAELVGLQETIDKVKLIAADVKKQEQALVQEINTKADATIKIKRVLDEARKVVKKNRDAIDGFEKKKGTKCPSCFGDVKEENFANVILTAQNELEIQEEVISKETVHWENTQAALDALQVKRGSLDATSKKVSAKEREISNNQIAVRNRISELAKINKPEATTDVRLLEEQVESLKKRALEKKAEIDGPSPHAQIIKSSEEDVSVRTKDCVDKKQELEVVEKELPYYEFWVKAFGDKGIRKFVIDGIIPALNSRIAYWLQFLFEGKMKLTFDNELNETIEEIPSSDGDSFGYNDLSGGEQRRLNLAISQAFAYVMMLNSGVSPSIVFLDEVSTNVDPIGVEGIYNMIVELSKSKQVFVTTHDQGLLEILAGCESINLVRKNGFTTLV